MSGWHRRPDQWGKHGEVPLHRHLHRRGPQGPDGQGGTARVEAAREFLASAGGSLDSYYFALGADDGYIMCDLPDNVAAAATAMSAAATGMVVNRMVALLTPEEVDRAAAAKLSYDAPGT